MFKKILVALNRSPTHEVLLAAAIEMAQVHQAELMLLHALSGEEDESPLPISAHAHKIYWAPGSPFNLATWRQQWKTYERECLNLLKKGTAQALDAGVVAEYQQILGKPGHVICQLASSWGADLILMGSRGRTGLKEAVLGSVSNYVSHHAPCSVLTLKLPHGSSEAPFPATNQ